jgi:TP901 family phage tail tape measure protein
MTTKTVAVQLVAMTGQYQASMAKATASTSKLQTTAATTGRGIGRVMGPQIALGAAVAAGAAIKLSYDFEEAFTRIAAITDTSAARVGHWKEQVLALAGETAKAPKELADALYFLASAGLDADQVMPTLEASARAAATGLGETGDIARLTANAMNAYAKQGLTAAEVTDTLVAAVREGTAEPDEFADAMGRILPIASKAGISFDQVAASLSGLSNVGLDVNEGVTAMRGVMVGLLAPGKQAQDMLADLGLSADDVRQSLRKDGLIATLRMLDDATGGNIDQLRKIIPNVRAMSGAFGLTEQKAKKVDEVFKDVKDSAGAADEAFKKTAESSGHELRQALVDLRVAGIKLGDTLLPIFARMAENAAIMASAVVDAAEDIGDAVATGSPEEMMSALKTAFDKGKISVDQYAQGLKILADNGLISFDQLTELVGVAKRTAASQAEVAANVNHAAGAMVEGASEADRYSESLRRTPKQIRTMIRLEKEQAQRALSAFIGALNLVPDVKDVLIRVRSTGPGTGQQIGHSGGVVGSLPRYHGGGDAKSDEQLVLARKGEHILTDAQYRARSVQSPSTAHTQSAGDIRVGIRLDRRRFTTELDHDATYAGHWS